MKNVILTFTFALLSSVNQTFVIQHCPPPHKADNSRCVKHLLSDLRISYEEYTSVVMRGILRVDLSVYECSYAGYTESMS